MKKMDKKEINSLLTILGKHIERYWILAIIISSVLIALIVATMIAWAQLPYDTDIPQSQIILNEWVFYILQSLLLAATLSNIVQIILNRKGKMNARQIAISYHIYSFLLIAFGTASFALDVGLGFTALIYLLILTFIAGLVIVEPIFYCITAGTSLVVVIVASIINPNLLFHGDFLVENIINLVLFVAVVVAIAIRNYRVTTIEYKYAKKLEDLSYNDELTGLLNERSYVLETEFINKRIDKGEDVNFAVILMDVNNLKATNDAYGHRFGCSLIVRCGHTLPTIFKTSKLFHAGGDEFIAIIYDEDYQNFEKVMEDFDNKMLYSLVDYEGVELIFSVARGYSKYEKGQHYKDVLQIADKAMYENKAYLKEKYHMAKR